MTPRARSHVELFARSSLSTLTGESARASESFLVKQAHATEGNISGDSPAAGSHISVCTATLVANDVVITNSHCFPAELGAPEQLCSSNAKVVFPASGSRPTESVECAAVLEKSDLAGDKFDRPDYMVLKLKKATDRGAHSVSREGMRDGEKLKVYKVNPLPNNGGTLIGETCEVLYGTVIRPQADEPENPSAWPRTPPASRTTSQGPARLIPTAP